MLIHAELLKIRSLYLKKMWKPIAHIFLSLHNLKRQIKTMLRIIVFKMFAERIITLFVKWNYSSNLTIKSQVRLVNIIEYVN